MRLEGRVVPEFKVFSRLHVVVAIDEESGLVRGMKPIPINHWLMRLCLCWQYGHILQCKTSVKPSDGLFNVV